MQNEFLRLMKVGPSLQSAPGRRVVSVPAAAAASAAPGGSARRQRRRQQRRGSRAGAEPEQVGGC